MTEKQQVQGALLKHGMVYFRGQFHATAWERLTLPIWEPRRWRYNRDLANLLHRLGETVNEQGFTDTDISFLNHAIPVFLSVKANNWDTGLLELLVQFHDCVPPETAGKVTWHPSDAIRKRLTDLDAWRENSVFEWLPGRKNDEPTERRS